MKAFVLLFMFMAMVINMDALTSYDTGPESEISHLAVDLAADQLNAAIIFLVENSNHPPDLNSEEVIKIFDQRYDFDENLEILSFASPDPDIGLPVVAKGDFYKTIPENHLPKNILKFKKLPRSHCSLV